MLKVKENSIIEAPSMNRINRLQEFSKVNYPKDYVEFILSFNGGIPITNKLPLNSRNYIVERFLCITENPKESAMGQYDISVVLTQIDERLTDNPDALGDELIPIAILFAGDFVCLDYRNSSKPSICIWFHEESEVFAPVTKRCASNFQKFIDMLK